MLRCARSWICTHVRPVRYFPGVPSPLRAPGRSRQWRSSARTPWSMPTPELSIKLAAPENEKVARFLREEMGAQFLRRFRAIRDQTNQRLRHQSGWWAQSHPATRSSTGRASPLHWFIRVTSGSSPRALSAAWGYEVAQRGSSARSAITEDELWKSAAVGPARGQDCDQKDRIAYIQHVSADAAEIGLFLR